MPEAVIVAAARSPIGRARKGSLVDVRPDDLAAGVISAALDQVPALDPAEMEDLMSAAPSRGMSTAATWPGGSAVLLGWTRCRRNGQPVLRLQSSQTARMAFHAIKAGEGHAFVSRRRRVRLPVPRASAHAGVDPVDSHHPGFADAEQRTAAYAASNETWHDPREDG